MRTSGEGGAGGDVKDQGRGDRIEPTRSQDEQADATGTAPAAEATPAGSAARPTPSRPARVAGRGRRGQVKSEAWARTPPARLVRGAVQAGVLVPLLRFISPFNVIGRRNLNDLKGPAVFVANHQSHFDAPVCLAALPGRFRHRLGVAAPPGYL